MKMSPRLHKKHFLSAVPQPQLIVKLYSALHLKVQVNLYMRNKSGENKPSNNGNTGLVGAIEYGTSVDSSTTLKGKLIIR